MDQKGFNERVKRLEEINRAIEKLDSTIRAQAFELLKDYATVEASAKKVSNQGKAPEEHDTTTMEEFFKKHEHAKPSDNVLLAAAYHYSQYGTAAFSINEIVQLATIAGLTIPTRIDKTLSVAKRGGKKLFQKQSKGLYKPTVSGETLLKEQYQVAKGRKTKTDDADPDSD